MENNESKLVVICGIPRSGTSLVAAIVDALGFKCHRGGVTQWTPIGSFMDPVIEKIDGFSPSKVYIDEFKERYSTGLKSFKFHGFNRQRTVNLVNSIGIHKCLVPWRPKKDVLASLTIKRNGNMENAVRRYNISAKRVFNTVYEWEKSRVNFNLLISDPLAEVRKIATYIGAEEHRIEGAAALVRKELKHHGV